MLITTFDQLTDYRLLDTGAGYRLEQWGDYRLARPDPQAIWQRHLPESEWKKAHAIYQSHGEKGSWQINKKLPDFWTINYRSIILKARLTPFKHTGIFAEQAANWDWMMEKLRGRKAKVLNLFGYTGGASVVLAKAGHFVTHVDASKPAIGWAKDNHKLNGLPETTIRWILDDAAKFVAREVKRGQNYDAIIMDPPAFGHAPSGKVWKFSKDLPKLLDDCVRLLSQDASFLLVNAYATNSSPLALGNLLEDALLKKSGTIENGELCLQQSDGRLISTGILARWSS
jgi:23S rRNA (cytosine1962-C5)-methyltransferase